MNKATKELYATAFDIYLEDIIKESHLEKEVEAQTGQAELVVKQHRGELHPQIVIYAAKEFEERKPGAFALVQSLKRYFTEY